MELAKSQVLSQLAAIRAGRVHDLGRRLVAAFGEPLQADPARGACVLATLGAWLNLDDTAYAGHLSPSTVAVPLAYAHSLRLDGARLLTAIVAANECAARVTAAATLGPFRGQTAAHTSVVGAVAGRLHCTGQPAAGWVDALGLALAMPPWTLLPGFLGGDARAISGLVPVRAAMDACDAAAAGLRAADDILEHPGGFLDRFAAVPLPEVVTARLGQRWHTDTLSFKIRPGGPGIDSAVDCALALRDMLPAPEPDEITEILVETSAYTMYVERQLAAQGPGPMLPAGVLPLSVPYAVATALLTGRLTVADFATPARHDPRRWRLAARVRLVEDPGMTRDLIGSDAPFGDALRQAGERAKPWLAGFVGARAAEQITTLGPPAATFTDATKHTGSRVTVRLADGGTLTARRDIPIGAAGPDTRATHRELVRSKFAATGGPPDVAETCAALDHASSARVAAMIRAALRID
ncbi:MmgE/PrpD family protein [Frankia sp. Ag45/Mut15]|uniref:MmgE/PrpD family protein n=1 Tax=Frankia umida TaxID=573489 RepID=A0ABT0K5S0_9ACTN|nr:MmgE/PrpD family protein [Frankia umida]